jgi:hypothetical protein
MARFFIIFSLFCLSIASSMAQVALIGIEEQLEFVSFNQEATQIIGYGSDVFVQGQAWGQKLIVWDARSGATLMKVDVGELVKKSEFGLNKQLNFTSGFSSCVINPAKSILCFIATNVVNEKNGERYATLMAFYELQSQQVRVVTESKIQVTSIQFHPNNPDLLGLTAVDESTTEAFACLYNVQLKAIDKKLMSDKSGLNPLKTFFGTSGAVIIPYSKSSSTGGISIYSQQGVLVKSVAINDHAVNVFEKEGQYIVEGNSATYFIHASTYTITKTLDKILIHDLNAAKTFASLVTRESLLNQTKNQNGLFVYDLLSAKKIQLGSGNAYLSSIAPTERIVVFIVEKGYYDTPESKKAKPSALIYAF